MMMKRRNIILFIILLFFCWNLVMLFLFGYSQTDENNEYNNDIENLLMQKLKNQLEEVRLKNDNFELQIAKFDKNIPSVVPIPFSTIFEPPRPFKPLKKLRITPKIPILVMACNRQTIKRTLDQILQYRTTRVFPIIVSQDCADEATANIIYSYRDKITFIQQPDQSDFELPTKLKSQVGYYKIARHYKWALDQLFYRFNYSSAIIVEDDLDISPDFFEYFLGMYNVLRSDRSLWCVSAWNDNGKQHMVDNNAPELLYRTDFFPGLGWMILKSTWNELSPKWPIRYWDDWMRHPDQRKNRSCIRPEIPRTSTFGRIGVSKGQYFDKHLQFIKHNTKFIPFSQNDYSYLLKENYDPVFRNRVYSLPITSVENIASTSSKLMPNISYQVQYFDRTSFVKQAKLLEIMEDVKFGVPRAAYMAIVSILFKGQRVYLSPPSNWTGYDETWL